MPGRHTSKQKRQAEHVADSERRSGKDPDEAKRIGWATVNARKGLAWGRDDPNVTATPHHGSYDIIPKRGGSAKLLYHKKAPLGAKAPSDGSHRQNLGVHRNVAAAQAVAEKHHASQSAPVAKSLSLVSLDDAYGVLLKDQAGREAYHANAAKVRQPDPSRTSHVDRPPPPTSDVSSRPQSERRKFPRKLKPTVAMKPISDEEAMRHLASGTYSPSKQKSLRWLRALKALATGYSKVAGGGALKAANRGTSLMLLGPSGRKAGKSGGHYRKRSRSSGETHFGPDGRPGPKGDKAHFKELRRAMAAMSSPSGSAKPPKVYLPGVHSPKSPVRSPLGLKKPSLAKKQTLVASMRPSTSSDKSPRVLDAGGAAELSNSLDNVVIKSEGAVMTSMNFNDLFKAELGASGDDVLVDCPHCEAPITKSDLAKAHKGKGKTTNVSGAKRGKSSAHVSEQFPEGGAMRGGDGRGVLTSSRGVPGAQKTDAVVGIQNGKGSNARKGGADSSVEEGEDDVDKSVEAPPAKPALKKAMVTIRGTEFVQYVDDGSDAALAKAIAEGGFGGTQPTQPLDLNNDLSRLLV